MRFRPVKIGQNMWKKNSSTIMATIGIVESINACRKFMKAKPVADELLKKAHRDREEDYEDMGRAKQIFEDAKIVAPVYASAVASEAITIGCFCGMHHVNTKAAKQYGMLAAAYDIARQENRDYKEATKEVLSRSKEAEVRSKVAEKKMKRNPPSDKIDNEAYMGDMDLCYDALSKRYFRTTMERIGQIEKKLSLDLAKGYVETVTINDIYWELDDGRGEIGPLKGLGDYFGWVPEDEEVKIPVSSQITPNGKLCLVIDMDVDELHYFGRNY